MDLKLVCILCLALFPVLGNSTGVEPPSTITELGRIVGTRVQFSPVDTDLHRTVHAYLGVPYAEPPVGPLRFKAPLPKSPWPGELLATELGNRCPQPLWPLGNNVTLGGQRHEDCLFLDIFVPQPVPSGSAVLVYIHGGGFMVGAGSLEGYYGSPIAAIGDVIVVAVNYRLGALGFLSTGDDVISGNMGLLDQRLALKWIQNNIKAFGGDPDRVAVFGESAGAASVGLHTISPGSAGLFRGAIMESGEGSAFWATTTVDAARKRAFGLGRLLGCDGKTSEDLLKCVQEVDFDTIVENQFEKLIQELGEAPVLLFMPVVDGTFLPGNPADLYAKGAVNDIVSIIGSNSNEGSLMVKNAYPDSTEEAPFVDSAMYDALTHPWVLPFSAEPIVAEAVKLMYRDATCADRADCDYRDSVARAAGDVMFFCPQDAAARAFTKAGRKVYRFHMTHVPTTSLLGEKWTGCTHGDDLPFVFGVPLSQSEGAFTEEEAHMSIQIINYWANLAKTGNPNLPSLDAEVMDEQPEWPFFTLEELTYKDLSPDMPNGRAIRAKECLM